MKIYLILISLLLSKKIFKKIRIQENRKDYIKLINFKKIR